MDEQVFKTWCKGIDKKLDEITVLLTGGGNPHRGLLIRVDRLEQRSSRWAWVSRLVITTIVAATISAVTVVALR